MRVSIAWTLVAFCAAVAVAGEADISAQNSNKGHKRARVAKVRPHQSTEVVADEMWITTDSNGRRKITMSGPLEKGRVERLFWVVDSRDNSYQILRLTKDDNRDARRLRKAYQRIGVDLSEETIAERLTRERTADEETQRTFTDQSRSPDGGAGDLEPDVSEFDENGRRIHGPAACGDQWAHTCRGFGWSNVQTWEPARHLFNVLHLNETQAAASWTKTTSDAGASISVSRSGYCWANPQTFIFTHWYTTFCQQYDQNSCTGFDLARVGNHINQDFALYLTGTPRVISITAEASVQSYNGIGNWGAQYWEDTQDTLRQFYATFFLSGKISGQAWEGDCVTYCSPTSLQVLECENQAGSGIVRAVQWEFR